MRVAVIGGGGFIGSEVVRHLLESGSEVIVIDRKPASPFAAPPYRISDVTFVCADILDANAMRRALEGAIEVYHLAGKLGTAELEGDVRTAIDSNIVGSVNVFEAAIAAGARTIFHASKPNVWLNAYTITKYAAEQFALLYAEYYPVRICGLRYFNAYGPRQGLYPVRKIVPAFAAQAIRGLPIAVYGDGEQTVDMIYARDLGRLTVEYARSTHVGPPPDCGRGIAMTVNEVAHAVNAYFDNRAGVMHVPMRRGETPSTRLVADITSLEGAIGSLRCTPWEESLAATLSWYAAVDAREIDSALQCYGLA